MTQVLRGVYIGSQTEAHSRAFLLRSNISHILCCAPDIEAPFGKDYIHKEIPLLLIGGYDPSVWFDSAALFIHTAIEDGTGILVHDLKCDSRSTAMVLAYMIKYLEMTLDLAFRQILDKKSDSKLNRHYERHVREYEQICQEKKDRSDMQGAQVNQERLLNFSSRSSQWFATRRPKTNVPFSGRHRKVGQSQENMPRRYKTYQTEEDADFDNENQNGRMHTVQFDGEAFADPDDAQSQSQVSQQSQRAKHIKGFGKTQYANIVDTTRPVTSQGAFKNFDKLAQPNSNSNKNPNPKTHRPDSDKFRSIGTLRYPEVDGRPVTPKPIWEDSQSQAGSNRSLKMRGNGPSRPERFIGVISKPFKTEYDHEYGGGRLNTDPRTSSTGRWYVPATADRKIFWDKLLQLFLEWDFGYLVRVSLIINGGEANGFCAIYTQPNPTYNWSQPFFENFP